jgi:hypothetical protein
MLKKILDKGYYLQTAAIISLKDFLRSDRIRSDREITLKINLCRHIIDKNLRETHKALRMLKYHSQEELDREQRLYSKLRGICNRFASGNLRLMTMGYNKLIEEHKIQLQNLRDKVRFILASIKDVDKRHVLMAYNGLKINMHVQDGVGIYPYPKNHSDLRQEKRKRVGHLQRSPSAIPRLRPVDALGRFSQKKSLEAIDV